MNGLIQTVRRTTQPGSVFSIIIPTWNSLSYLKLCLESIKKNSAFKHQIIVHVNEGTDGTLEWLNSQEDIDLSYSAENIGVCYALNYCRQLVSTDYILYMNDDMYACPGWDKELYDEIQRIGHKYFFLSGTAIESFPQSNCSIEADFGSGPANFNEKELLEHFESLPKQDWQGATWPPNVVHKDVWDLVGGYSIEFSPGMYSDPDFSMKLWKLGIRLFKGLSKSRVYHFGSRSTKRIRKNKGYNEFIVKWGMTSSTLTKYYLRRGMPFGGILDEPILSWWIGAKNFFKRIGSAVRMNG